MTAYRIIRRAFSDYTDHSTFIGSYLAAIEFASKIERERADGEYLVRSMDEPNWSPASSYQSGMDWL